MVRLRHGNAPGMAGALLLGSQVFDCALPGPAVYAHAFHKHGRAEPLRICDARAVRYLDAGRVWFNVVGIFAALAFPANEHAHPRAGVVPTNAQNLDIWEHDARVQ